MEYSLGVIAGLCAIHRLFFRYSSSFSADRTQENNKMYLYQKNIQKFFSGRRNRYYRYEHKAFNLCANFYETHKQRMKTGKNQQINRQWFDFYMEEMRKSSTIKHKKFDNYFLCPCCCFPTLTKRQGYDICFLCNWEDDGQDNHNADKVLGGPNRDYSLTEARNNFEKYFTSYRPADIYHFERTTVRKSIEGKIVSDLTEIKKGIIEKYNLVFSLNDINERRKIFTEIKRLTKLL